VTPRYNIIGGIIITSLDNGGILTHFFVAIVVVSVRCCKNDTSD